MLQTKATPEQRDGMRAAVMCQCLMLLSSNMFSGGLFLLLFKCLGIPSGRVIFYLSLLSFAYLAILPLASLADRWGIKKMGRLGNILSLMGFALFIPASLLSGMMSEGLIVWGILIFSLGNSAKDAGWFALLGPVVPANQRGRFFGILRVAWQLAAILLLFLAGLHLGPHPRASDFVPVLLAGLAGLLIGAVFYEKIPEIEADRTKHAPATGFWKGLTVLFRSENFLAFNVYLFFLTLVTASAPLLFKLLGKDVLHLGDNQIVWMGNLFLLGSMAGYAAGSWAVDSWGAKPVFLCAHLLFGLLMTACLLRDLFPATPFHYLASLTFLLGFVSAGVSLAVTSEMYDILPSQNKSLAASVCAGLPTLAAAFSGFACSGLLDSGALSDQWMFRGLSMSRFDTLLLLCSGGVFLLIITLGLIPSVRGHAGQLPTVDKP